MADVGLPLDAPVRAVLHEWFTWATRTHLARYPRSAEDVPTGLRLPRWGWDGLQQDPSDTPHGAT
jgi:hemoglobin